MREVNNLRQKMTAANKVPAGFLISLSLFWRFSIAAPNRGKNVVVGECTVHVRRVGCDSHRNVHIYVEEIIYILFAIILFLPTGRTLRRKSRLQKPNGLTARRKYVRRKSLRWSCEKKMQ
jgi:hypothetical protein